MELKHTLTSDEKLHAWGYGEWVEEPDEGNFSHEGFSCKVIRIIKNDGTNYIFGGHWCGYIRIPEGHPWHGLDDGDSYEGEAERPAVHGGITYRCTENDGHWIGFDCAHSGDLTPSHEVFKKQMSELSDSYRASLQKLEEIEKSFKLTFRPPTYKNLSFVVEECKSLAKQALDAMNNIKK
jgi:hypothetical protein